MKKHCFFASKAVPGLLILSLVLGGCGGGKSIYSSISAETAAAMAPVGADYGMGYDMAAPAPMEEGFYDDYDYEVAYEEASNISSGGLTDSSSMNQAVPLGRKLIRDVSISVETDGFDQLIEKIQEKATELSGYIEQSDISGNRTSYNSRYAYLTVRIPSDQIDQFIDLVEGNGNVTRKSESIQDITLQYSDLESRKKTLAVEQDRIWALLEKADTLEAVIALEERLSEIRYELESMESRLRLFDNQVEYSTIDISIDEVLPVDFTPTAPENIWQRIQKGFSRNVSNMAEFATDLFIALVVLIPVWVPFGAIIAVVVILLKRRSKKRGKKKTKKDGTLTPAAQETVDPAGKEHGQESPDQGSRES